MVTLPPSTPCSGKQSDRNEQERAKANKQGLRSSSSRAEAKITDLNIRHDGAWCSSNKFEMVDLGRRSLYWWVYRWTSCACCWISNTVRIPVIPMCVCVWVSANLCFDYCSLAAPLWLPKLRKLIPLNWDVTTWVPGSCADMISGSCWLVWWYPLTCWLLTSAVIRFSQIWSACCWLHWRCWLLDWWPPGQSNGDYTA